MSGMTLASQKEVKFVFYQVLLLIIINLLSYIINLLNSENY